MIVMKFGGTSVQDAAAIERLTKIVARERERRPVVVVSAVAGATNTLVDAGRKAFAGEGRAARQAIAELMERHRTILRDLRVEEREARELTERIDRTSEELTSYVRGVALLRELTPRARDAISSHGERLSAALVAAALRARGLPTGHVDVRDVMATDDRFGQARPDRAKLADGCGSRIRPLLESGRVVVTEGFLGRTPAGETTTLGRGGSDFTAALIGAALGADEIQIWTDVDGMLTADSRVVPESMKIRSLSFAEAAELAYFGAKVLHPATIEPALARNIPVRILNSRRPDASGTTITAEAARTGAAVKSIAAKKGVTVVHVQSLRMLMAHGFLRSMFEVFDRHEVPVDLVSTSEVGVSLTIDDTSRLDEIVEDLSRFSQVRVDPACSIVCVVGEELRSTPGIAARAFGALGDINVRMISQGASEMNLSFVVQDKDADESVRRLHREFFKGVDLPHVFEPVGTERVS
jgi:aspartate kinase